MKSAAALPRYRARTATATDSASFAIPSLDGLRAVAIAVVLAYHYGHLSGGFLGVDLFFVLSGYLITRLLISEQQRAGRFKLGWFWARRVRRLAPAIIVLLLTVLVWVHFLDGPSLHRQTVGQARSALIYGSNWYNVLAHVGYWDVNITSTPLNHLWSLAIEEQFYLVWPLVAAVFLNRWRRAELLAWLAAGLAVVSMVLTPIVYAGFGVNAAYLGTETRIGAILLGAALALFAHRGGVTRTAPSGTAKLLLNVAATAGAAWFGYACVTASVQSAALYRGGLAASSLAELALVAAVALYPGGVLDRVLGLSPIVALGRRSYSLYLWHYPIYALVSPQWTPLTGHALLGWRLCLTAVATEVSYRLVEAPIRRSAIPGRRLVIAALVPVLGGSRGVLRRTAEANATGQRRTGCVRRQGSRSGGQPADHGRRRFLGGAHRVRVARHRTATPRPDFRRLEGGLRHSGPDQGSWQRHHVSHATGMPRLAHPLGEHDPTATPRRGDPQYRYLGPDTAAVRQHRFLRPALRRHLPVPLQQATRRRVDDPDHAAHASVHDERARQCWIGPQSIGLHEPIDRRRSRALRGEGGLPTRSAPTHLRDQ